MKFCHGVQDIPKCTTHFHHDSSMKHNSPGDTETFNQIYKKKIHRLLLEFSYAGGPQGACLEAVFLNSCSWTCKTVYKLLYARCNL